MRKIFDAFPLLSKFSILVLLAFAVVLPVSQSHADTKIPVIRGMQVQPNLTADDIAVLKSWKVNAVRYPIVWGDQVALDASNADTYAAWLDSAMDLLDQQIPLYQAAGIKLIVNLYSPPGGFSRRDSKAAHRIFQKQWAQDAYLASWDKVASRFANNPQIIAMDLLNEPAQYSRPASPLLDWNALALAAANKIRSYNGAMPIVLSPLYGKTTQIVNLKKMPLSNVIYTIHFYEPWRFVHQGIFNSKVYKYPDSYWNRGQLQSSLTPIINFQKKNKVRVYVGEFSVARWAPKASSKTYLNDLFSLFEKYKWDWTYHAFREANVWSLEYSETKSDNTPAKAPTERFKIVSRYLAKNKSL